MKKKMLDMIMEEYGGQGPMILPDSHKAGMQVPKGGSCCLNCEYWNNNGCTNKYYQKWAGTDKIPVAPDEYCTNWWEPKHS